MNNQIDIVKKSLIRRSSESSVMDYGKMPPQSKELEEAVLGAVMIESAAMDIAAPFMKPEVFYLDAHQRISKAIMMLYLMQEPIDLLTVTEQLKQNGDLDAAGGPFYVAQLTNKVGSAANIETHIRYVFEKYIQRQLICFSTEIIKDSYEDTSDVFDTFDRTEKGLRLLKQEFFTGSISTTSSVLEEADRQMLSGFVRSKHNFINKAFGGGWQKGTLNIVAARPAMGKSAFKVSDMISCVDAGYQTASINLEMMQKQLVTRIICNKTSIPNTRYRSKNFFQGDDEKILDARQWIKNSERNFTMDFPAAITVYDLIAKMKKIKSEKGLDIAYIDHLQFIALPSADTKGKTKDEQIGIITRAIKSFAKEEDVAVVLFCHLSRATEQNSSKRPGLSHLRESGNIENDADTVSFLFRPEYYFDKDENGIPQYKGAEEEKYRNICKWLCDKNRDGHSFESIMRCYLGISTFVDEEVALENEEYHRPAYAASSSDAKDMQEDSDPPF